MAERRTTCAQFNLYLPRVEPLIQCQGMTCTNDECCLPTLKCGFELGFCAMTLVEADPETICLTNPCGGECCVTAGLCDAHVCQLGVKKAVLPLQCARHVCVDSESCGDAPRCSSYAACAGTGLVKKAGADTLSCAAAVCTDLDCCAFPGQCAGHACQIGILLFTNKLCPSPVCSDSDCCGDAPFCPSASVCTAGYVARADAQLVRCAAATCMMLECCTLPGHCAAHECVTGVNKAGAAAVAVCPTPVCADAICCELAGFCLEHECVNTRSVVPAFKRAQRCVAGLCTDAECCIPRQECDVHSCAPLLSNDMSDPCATELCSDAECCLPASTCRSNNGTCACDSFACSVGTRWGVAFNRTCARAGCTEAFCCDLDAFSGGINDTLAFETSPIMIVIVTGGLVALFILAVIVAFCCLNAKRRWSRELVKPFLPSHRYC
jgi:hypothetical protein